MQVRFLQSIAGTAEPMYDLPDFSFAPGESAELDDILASHWIAAGIVEVPKAVKGPKPARAAAVAAAAVAEVIAVAEVAEPIAQEGK